MFKPSCRKSTLGLLADQEVLEVTESLDFAAQSTPLQRDVLIRREVRNWDKTFGVESLDELKSYDEEQLRFTAISTSRGTAEEEFTTYGKAGAFLRVTSRKGTPGIWMPTNGDKSMAYQQEFLIPLALG